MQALLFLGGLAAFLGPISLGAADPGQQVLDAMAHGEDERFAVAGNELSKLATDKDVCGVHLPYFPETLTAKPTEVKVLGHGAFGKTWLHKFAENEGQCSTKEKRLLSPQFVTKRALNGYWSLGDMKAAEMKMKEEFLKEAIIGILMSSSALPESPVAQLAGMGTPQPTKSIPEPYPMSVLALAGQKNLASFLKAGVIRKGAANLKRDVVGLWETYSEKVSFVPGSASSVGADANAQPLSPEQLHHLAMARHTDSSLVVLQQLVMGLEHFHEQGVAHEDVKWDNVALGAGTIRILDFGLADAATTSYFPPTSQQASDSNDDEGGFGFSPRPYLPESFRGFQSQCVPVPGSKQTIKDLLQHKISKTGTLLYTSPLPIFSLEPAFKTVAGQLLGPKGLADLIKTCKVTKNNKLGTLLTQQAADRYSVGLAAVELLLGASEQSPFLADIACDRPRDVAEMSRLEKDTRFCSPINNGFWRFPRLHFGLSAWLAGDDFNLYKKPSNNGPAPASQQQQSPQTLQAAGNKNPASDGDDDGMCGYGKDALVGLQEKLEESKNDDDEEALLTNLGFSLAPALKQSESYVAHARRRTYSWLYALSRYVPVAQLAVATGKRPEFSGDVPRADSRFASAMASNDTTPDIVIVDASTSTCPKELLRVLASQGPAATIPFDLLSAKCIAELQTFGNMRHLQVKNLPPDTPVEDGFGTKTSNPAVGTVAAGISKPLTNPANLPAPKPASLPAPPRFLRSGMEGADYYGRSEADTDANRPAIDPALVSYTSGDGKGGTAEVPVFPDSPLGYLFRSPPRLDGKFDTVMPHTFTLEQKEGANAKVVIKNSDFPSIKGPSDKFPLLPLVDTTLVKSLKGKSLFSLTEDDLKLSAEESPHALELDFQAKPATTGILDLVRGLLTLHAPLQPSMKQAAAMIDRIRQDLLVEMGIDGQPKADLKAHLTCVSMCVSVVQAHRNSNGKSVDAKNACDSAVMVAVGSHRENSKTLAPFCEKNLLPQLLKYEVDGVGFTKLVGPSYGITTVAFESMCRTNICAKGSPVLAAFPRDDDRPIHLPSTDTIKQATPASFHAHLDVLDPLAIATREWKAETNKQSTLGYAGRMISQLFSPSGKAFTYIPREKSAQESVIRGYFTALAAEIKAQGPRAPAVKKQQAKYVTPAIASFSVRKGPFGARFFTSFSSYQKARRLDLFLESDPSEQGKTAAGLIRPAIRWVSTKDKITKKKLKNERNFGAFGLTDFEGGSIKDSRPLYLNAEKIETCRTIAERQGNAAPKYVRQGCDDALGICVCLPIGRETDPYALDGYLRVLFVGGEDAAAFAYTVKELLTYAARMNNEDNDGRVLLTSGSF